MVRNPQTPIKLQNWRIEKRFPDNTKVENAVEFDGDNPLSNGLAALILNTEIKVKRGKKRYRIVK
jgi:hypothetical protein